jgi:hypothetical protein
VTKNCARFTCEIKSWIVEAKAAFYRKKSLFISKFDFNLRKKLVKCYIWSIALCAAETLTLGKVLKCGAGEGRRKSGG